MKINRQNNLKQRAFSLLVAIGFMAIIVGGAVVTTFILHARHWFPTDPLGNPVGTTYETNITITYNGYVTNIVTNLPNSMLTMPLRLAPPELPLQSTFTVQYMVGGDYVPLIGSGELQPIADGVAYTVVNVEGLVVNWYTWGGVAYCQTDWGDEFGNMGGQVDILTNSTVIIQRSVDLVNWEPVFTNSDCAALSLQTWSDDLQPAAFYRAERPSSQP